MLPRSSRSNPNQLRAELTLGSLGGNGNSLLD